MTATEFVIETNELTRYFGRRKAVDTVTMRVPRGSVFAFLGRNGSGKTTTIRMLLGLLRPTRGSSRVLGEDSLHLSPAIRGRIGYMSESHSLHDWMTVAQEGYFQSQFYPGWTTRIFRSIIGHFGLSPDARIRSLSRGERAGLSLAITLAPQPDLLILDDPAIGLDPVARRSLLESMLYVTRGAGRTILFSSHLLDDVERVADYAAVLDRSVLRAVGSTEELTSAMRQFTLSFAPGRAPQGLPPIRGMVSSRRTDDVVRIIVARPGDDTRGTIAALGPVRVDEQSISFADAMVAFLGARGEQRGFLDDAVMDAAGARS
jgi:ABC-2 type transport system ATP-binding protein